MARAGLALHHGERTETAATPVDFHGLFHDHHLRRYLDASDVDDSLASSLAIGVVSLPRREREWYMSST
jgi:hypothetical protein